MSATASPAVGPSVGRAPRVFIGVLMVLALAMAGGGVVLLERTHDLRSVAAADNDALVDKSATADVQKQVASALTRILTFDHTKPEQTQAAADQVLAGDARKEYGELFSVLLKQAGSQELTLKTKVDIVGVKTLTSSSADLLVFLDQSSTRGTDDQSNVAAAQLEVKAAKDDGRWRITELNPL